MSRRIKIYDGEAILHLGTSRVPYAVKDVPDLELGGIRHLLGFLAIAIKENDIPVVVFDSKTNRDSILSGCKKNKVSHPGITAQRTICLDMLPKCGITVGHVNEHESEDEIANYVFANKGRLPIRIIGDDKDLANNVDSGIALISPKYEGKVITLENYETVLDKKEQVPYNSINLFEVLGGSSNSVPGGIKMLTRRRDLMNHFIALCDENDIDASKRGDKDLLLYWARTCELLSEEERDILYPRIEVICPRFVDDLTSYEVDLNWAHSLEGFLDFCSLVEEFDAPVILGHNYISGLKEKYTYLKEINARKKSGFLEIDEGMMLARAKPTEYFSSVVNRWKDE